MHVFVIGATGYIGGTVAAKLLAAGHAVTGLTRTTEGAAALTARGITPVIGTLDDHALLTSAAKTVDAVVSAASADHRGPVEAILPALEGTNKPFLHTSGSSIVSDPHTVAPGDPTDAVFDEDTRFTPAPERAARVALNAEIRAWADRGVRTAVLCPPLIYGRGLGVHEESVQVPLLERLARASGGGRYIGQGRNVWSTVHIEDVADLYLLALEKAPAGSFFFAENGEAAFGDLAGAIHTALQFTGTAQSIPFAEAAAVWGEGTARFTMGSNSRVCSGQAREILGWRPSRPDVFDDIRANVRP